MGRRRTGTIIATPQGRWKVRVHRAPGPSSYMTATFDTEQEAESFRTAAAAALAQGQAPPAPDLFRNRAVGDGNVDLPCSVEAAAQSSIAPQTIATVAAAWIERHYVLYRKGGADRERSVRITSRRVV